MSASRSRYSQTRPSRITDDEISDLIYKLQQLIPHDQIHTTHYDHHHKVSSTKVLEETCSYLKRLRKEVEDLSQRLSELLESMDSNSPQAAIIRTLLMSP